MARPLTTDQTPTEQFNIPTIPIAVLDETFYCETPSSEVPKVVVRKRPHRHRKATWGDAWREEIHRREFRIYAAACLIVGMGVFAIIMMLGAPIDPRKAPQDAAVATPRTSVTMQTPRHHPSTLSVPPVAPVRPKHVHHAPTSPSVSVRPSRKHSEPPAATPTHHHSATPSPSKTKSDSPTPIPSKTTDSPATKSSDTVTPAETTADPSPTS